jgi:hypothetical protein
MVANRQYMVREEEEVALLNRFNTRPREEEGRAEKAEQEEDRQAQSLGIDRYEETIAVAD